jgi:hypothetical protein
MVAVGTVTTIVLVAVAVWLIAAQPWATDATMSPARAQPTGSSLTPTEKVATTTQYASALASPIRSFRKTWANYQDQLCAVDDTTACKLMTLTLNVDAQLIISKIAGAQKVGSTAYIGAPPAEIAALVEETRAAAAALDYAIPDDASEPTDNVFLRGGSLDHALDGWQPYM